MLVYQRVSKNTYCYGLPSLAYLWAPGIPLRARFMEGSSLTVLGRGQDGCDVAMGILVPKRYPES